MAHFDRSKGGPRGGTLRSGSGSLPAIGPGPSPSHTPLEEAPREAYFNRSKGGPSGGTLRSGSGSFPAIGPGAHWSPGHSPLEEVPRETCFDRSEGGPVERARSDQAQGHALGHRCPSSLCVRTTLSHRTSLRAHHIVASHS